MSLSPSFFTALCTLAAASVFAAEPAASIPLWPGGAPGSEAYRDIPEKIESGKTNLCSVHLSYGMAEVYLKYQAAGVPAEMHVYANAGHGFGYRPDSTGGAGDWPLRFREWLVDSKLLDEAPPAP